MFHPYKLVKDLRSGWETSDVAGFMDGDALDDVVAAFLRWKAAQGDEEQ